MNKYIDMWLCPPDSNDEIKLSRKSYGKPARDPEDGYWNSDDPERTFLCKKLMKKIITPLPKKEPELWRFTAKRC